MSVARIADPVRFIFELGGLHDCSVRQVVFDVRRHEIHLYIDDLAWGIETGGSHKQRPGILRLLGVSAFLIAAGQDKFHTSMLVGPTMISETRAIAKDGMTRLDVVMQTGEQWFIEFEHLEVEEP